MIRARHRELVAARITSADSEARTDIVAILMTAGAFFGIRKR